MALFGLGSFAEGFVGGLAESANKALLEDMKAVKDRVKTVSDFRVKRALAEQEKRAGELEEIEDALKEGASLFGDDPRAADYAASLLKDQGNITAYKKFIAEMREKKNTSGIDPAGFFSRAAADAPASKGFTVSDYAKAYQGAPKTLPDYRLPDDAATAGAGRLLGAIGLDQDVAGQIQERTTEQMSAIGVGEDVAKPSVSLPSIGFDSEEWSLADKDASAKIKYYNEKLVNPRLDEATRAKYEEKLQSQLGIAAESKDDDIRISALQQQLSRADVKDRPAIQQQIVEINVAKKRREAEAAVADGSDIMAVNKLNKADAYRRSQDENLSEEEREKALQEFYRIGEVLTDYSKGEPTVADTFAKRREDHRRKQVEDPTYKAGNLEFDAEVAELEKLERISTDGSTKDATTTGITASVKAIDLIISTNPSITANIPNNDKFQRIKKLVDGADTVSAGLALIDKEPGAREIYDQGMAAMRSAGQPIVDQYINALPEGKDKSSAIEAARLLGYDVSAYSATSTVEAAATAPASVTATGDTTTAKPPVSEEQAKKVVPDTPESAKNILNRLLSTGGNISEAIEDAKQRNYSPEFIKVLEAEKDTDTGMTSVAMEPGIDYDAAAKESTAAAEQDVEAASRIIDDVTGFASKEIRAIQKELGISREAATRLHAQAMAAKELSRTNTRSKRRGMMARSTTKAQS